MITRNRAGRPLTCTLCSRTFARAEHLQRHNRTHTKEKPFPCPCGLSFSRQDLLARHDRLSHGEASGAASRRKYTGSTRRISSSQRLNGPQASRLTPGSSNEPSTPHLWRASSTDHVTPSTSRVDLAGHNDFLTDPDTAYADAALEFSRFLDTAGLNFDLDLFLNGQDYQETLGFSDGHDSAGVVPNGAMGEDDFHELKPLNLPWRLNEQQRIEYSEQLAPFRGVLANFSLPSRLSLSRYIAGFFDGLSHHFPFIHMPTFSLTANGPAPELTLAVLAVGAQYRYESHAGAALYAAARAIVHERARRRELPSLHSASYSSSFPSPLPRAPPDLLATTRAVLLLAKFAAWQASPALVRESLSYRALLAHCTRRAGLSEPGPLDGEDDDDDWPAWARAEMDRRTKLCAFCFLNLQELAFGGGVEGPLLAAAEMDLRLPCSCREWLAEGRSDWLEARREGPGAVGFGRALGCVLRAAADGDAVPVTSPFGNFVLVHALLQRVGLARRLALDGGFLRAADVEELDAAFDRWRLEWRRAPESALDVRSSRDSLAFASTALFGLAHVRLHFELGPRASWASCDADAVAAAAWAAPPPRRGPQLLRALLHATHALNVPVQLGVDYLARFQSFSWSIQHVFCSFECAVFLSKWLCMLACEANLTGLEQEISAWVSHIVHEADGSLNGASLLSSSQMSQQGHLFALGVAVVNLWARTFKNSNTAWPAMTLVGESLEKYAVLLARQGPKGHEDVS